MCKFLNAYWITGEPRRRRQRSSYWHFGSLPNTTTALMEQRVDGIDFSVMFNTRRNDHYHADIEHLRNELRNALNPVSEDIKRIAIESIRDVVDSSE